MSENHTLHSHHREDEYEKVKLPLVVSLLLSSLVVFFLLLSGFTDEFSAWTENTLVEKLGYTNDWSVSYGPEWFVDLNKEIGALGGAVFMTIAVASIIGFYYRTGDRRRMWRFILIIVLGFLFMTIMKTIFSYEKPSNDPESFVKTVSTFPSGHAMMATIFYLTAAIYLTRRYRGTKIRRYYIVVASVIIILIGMSRVLGANHTPTEVIAGWSLGIIWLCLCWLVERFARIKEW
jgi:undecaprenyl-diphosphatase